MKNRGVAQGLDELWVEEPLAIDCQEAASASVTTDQGGNDEEPEECGDDEETREARDVIRGLEALWGKAPLPADFREVIATPLSSEPAK
ncbi:MAG: hypothetical protein OXP66_05570 [Candidatus Tectomicrobia bacterium]|nr:hypothetical protein [Candidatus Tectomicrobia bacterium]